MTAKVGTAAVSVGRDLGGVRITVGSGHFVLSPNDAVEFAKAILGHVGIVVEVDAVRPQAIIRPGLVGMNGGS